MMIKRLLRIFTYVAILSWTPNVLTDVRVCTIEEAQEVEMSAAMANSWMQLHQQFERYAHCDDGAIAEGFSESVSLLLAERWEDIGQLEGILKTDPTFHTFVIRHIDGTTPAERLGRIAMNAAKQCPISLKELCRDIENAAQQA